MLSHVHLNCMQVSLGPASGGGANASQLRNIALCSQLQEVHRSMITLLPRLPAAAAAALQGTLDALQGCAVDTGTFYKRFQSHLFTIGHCL